MIIEYYKSKEYRIFADGKPINLKETSDSNTTELPDSIKILKISENLKVRSIIADKSKLTKLVCNNNTLEILSINKCKDLQYIHIINTPLGNDPIKLELLSKSLPDRNDREWGSIIISDSKIRKQVEKKFIKKDWYFGSTLMYNNEKLNKIRQYQFETMGILDIWESAEYGEGKVVAIADTGFSMHNKEFNYSNCLGMYNFSFQKTSSNNPVAYPKSGTAWHGTAIASLMIAQGKDMWGAIPKSKYYLMKIGNSDSTSNTQIMLNACKKADELGCDVLNVSYSASPTPLKESEKEILDTFANKGSAYCQATGNNGSTRRIDLFPTSYKCAVGIAGNNSEYGFYNGNNYFNGIDFLAPGVCVYVEQNEGKYGTVNGTSAACPLLSSCYILMMILFEKKYDRKPTFNELVTYMSHRTIDAGRDVLRQGYGHFNFMAYNKDPKEPLYNIEVEVD